MAVLLLALKSAQAAVPVATALPQNPSVVSGTVGVTSAGTAMTVQQSSDKAIINWGGFDIGSSAAVTFQQPNSGSATLNRVTSGSPSQIMGRLNANGQVYIVNSNGVIFGEGAQVNVAGLVASTMDITDGDFESGQHIYIRQGATGDVINKGTIQTTSGGYVLLLGAKVSNAGTIKAPSGKVVAAAGERVSIPLTQSGLVSIEVDPSTIDANVTNEAGALLEASNGSVYLSARAASDVAASVVNKGVVRADMVTTESSGASVFLDAGSRLEGRQIDVTTGWLTGSGSVKAAGTDAHANLNADYISLSGNISADNAAGAGGLVQISGATSVMLSSLSKVSANGTSGGQVKILSQTGHVLVSGVVQANGTQAVGGTVEISGRMSATLLGATIAATGPQGGGTIHVGGSWQGSADLMRSKTTTADAKTTLTADAAGNGNGGEVVLWSQNATSFYGSIYARGGSAGGNGGRVELSSAGTLNVQIASSHGLTFGARHASGTPGLLLIDPMNVVIGDPVASFDVFKSLLTETGDVSGTGNLQASGALGGYVALSESYALISVAQASSNRGDVFLYNLALGVWTDLATTTGNPIGGLTSGSSFGSSVALNNTYALIGASGFSSSRGNVFLFNLLTGAWTDLATTAGQPITALASNSNFGVSAALNNTYALIGAQGVTSYRGNAYLYNLGTGAWTNLAATAGQPITALAGNAYFGASVALNNTYALIGAQGVTSNRGNAFLYNLGTSAWTNLAATAGQPITGLAANSYLGYAVALNETYALVGARGVLSNKGNAYLYNLGTGAWTDLAAVAGQPITVLTNNSYFGIAVALNSTYALIGASGYSNNRGNAYLYNLGTGAWTDLAAVASDPSLGVILGLSYFGAASALNHNYALIGAYGVSSNRGNAYLYNLVTGAWTDLAATAGQPITTLAANSYFGRSLGLNDTYAVIGAYGVSSNRGTAYLYNIVTGAWTDLATTAGQPITALAANSSFGLGIAVNDNYAAIGAYGVSSYRGNAYLYNLGTSVWTNLATTAGQPVTALASSSYFGFSVALNDTYALIGSYGVSTSRGNAFLYNLGTGGWTNLATTAGQPITALPSFSRFGYAVTLNDTYALMGVYGVSSNRGNAYLYNIGTGVWTDMATTAGQPITSLTGSSYFGAFAALNNSYALISAYGVSSNRGNAYLYNLNTGVWTDLATTSGAPISALASAASFGISMALSDDYALIGATGVSGGRGMAYLYNLSTGDWAALLSSTGQPIAAIGSTSAFGYATALNNTYALIGAYAISSNRGNAYLYNLSTGVWTDLATTTGQPITALSGSSYFGDTVALNSTYALIGAFGISANRGNAYLYNLVTGAWTDLATTAGQPITALVSAEFSRASIGLTDDYALIGANGVSSLRGTAYLYNLNTGAWLDLATTAGQPITALVSNSWFGYGVALSSTYALIGAHGVSSARGNAFLYNISTGVWTNLASTAGQPITALASTSRFGASLALNGSYALIGAYGVSTRRGTAYLYNLGTGAWTDLATTAGQPITALSTYSYVGLSVVLNNTYALIGAYGVSSDRGNAYLYNLGTGVWTNLATTVGQPITALASSSQFSYLLMAMNDTYALIGAPNVSNNIGLAYLYNLGTGAWTTLSGIKTSLGTSVSLSDRYAVIGAPGYLSGRGNAYVYNLENGVWVDLATTQGQIITTLAAGSNFGTSVAANNTYALFGANGVSGGRGNAYLYNLVSGAWTNLAATSGQPVTALAASSSFGVSVALNDTYALIGASGVTSGQGNSYLYNLVSGAWTNLAATVGEPVTALAANSAFGSSVALNDNYALIGANGVASGRGNAYLYNLVSSAWTSLAATVGEPVTALAANSAFGSSVALNDNYALIGASGVASGRGNAYLYNLGTAAWTDMATTAGQPVTGLTASALFGTSVALNDSYALIGASGVASGRGNAYLYNLGTAAWTDMAALSLQPITALSANSEFGKSVALNDDYALIGAPGAGLYRGNAYLLMLESNRISSATIQAALTSGNVVITADNRITVKKLNLTSANAGNSLTLQAGKDLLIENSIVLGGRTALLLANAPSSALGAASLRQAGGGGITLENGASINNAAGDLTLKVVTDADSERTGSTALAGDITLGGDILAGTLLIDGAQSSINATGNLSVSGINTALILNGRSINLTGAGSLTAANGRWMAYNTTSASLGTMALGALTPDFYRYGCSYAGGCTTGATLPAAGNGVVYAYAPTLTIIGMDSVTKVYDSTTAIDTTGASFSGFANGNTATLVANFNNKNVGTGKAISYELGTAYGYLLDGGASTGSITRASLSAASLVANNKIYDTTVAATLDVSGAVLTGVYGGDTVTVVSGAGTFADKNAATGKAVTATSVVLAGTDGGNYEVTGFNAGLTADITAKEITTATYDQTIYQGETTWGAETLTGIIGGDSVVTNKKLVATGGGLVDLDTATPAGTYAQRIIGLLGADAGNYLLAAAGNIEGLMNIMSLPVPASETNTLTPSIENVTANFPPAAENKSEDLVQTEETGAFGFVMQQQLEHNVVDVLTLYLGNEKATTDRTLFDEIQKHVPDVVSVKTVVSEEGGDVPVEWLYGSSGSSFWMSGQDSEKALSHTLTVMLENAQGKTWQMKIYIVNDDT